MARVTATLLTSNYDNVDGTVYSTATITPSANNLILLYTAARKSATPRPLPPTASGNGLTWVGFATVAHTGNLTSSAIFRALGTSPSTGVVSIEWPETVIGCGYSVIEFANVDGSGTNGSDAVVQFKTQAMLSGSTVITANLDAFTDERNATYGGFAIQLNQNVNPGDGFTEVSDNSGTTPDFVHASEFRNDNDTSVDFTWTTSHATGGMIAVEIKAHPLLDYPYLRGNKFRGGTFF